MIRMENKQARQFYAWQDEIVSAIVLNGVEEMIAECRVECFGQTALQEKFMAGVSAEDMAKTIPKVRGE